MLPISRILSSMYLYYRPSVISVTVTKGGHPSGGRLYGTSKTIRRGVAKSRGKFST